MSKKRILKKDKIKLAEKRALGLDFSFSALDLPRKITPEFDSHLVVSDLRKTVLVSAFVLGLELLVYWQLT